MNIGKGVVAVASAATLVFFGVAGCKSEVQGDCKGGVETVSGKRVNAEGYWVLDIACSKGGDKLIQWEPDDGNPEKGVGPQEWERYKVGDQYNG